MRKLLLIALLLPLLAATAPAQTNVLYGYFLDVTQSPLTNVPVRLVPRSPLNRTLDTNQASADVKETVTGAGGAYSLTNVAWGKYYLQFGDGSGTTFQLSVGTNTLGRVSVSSLVQNPQAVPPNPATNYYSMAQSDALYEFKGQGSGSGTDTNALRSSVWLAFTNGATSSVLSDYLLAASYSAGWGAFPTNTLGTFLVTNRNVVLTNNSIVSPGSVVITTNGTIIFYGDGGNVSGAILDNAHVKAGTSLTFDSGSDLKFNGGNTITGALPEANAAALTNLNASNLDSGTVADARLSGNVTKFGTNVVVDATGANHISITTTTNSSGIHLTITDASQTNGVVFTNNPALAAAVTTLTNNSEATTYANRLGIVDQSARDDLLVFEQFHRKSGYIVSNLWSDFVILCPKYQNTANVTSWKGTTAIVSNLNWTTRAAKFNNSIVRVPLQASNNCTVVIVWRCGSGATNANIQQYPFSLCDSNENSRVWINQTPNIATVYTMSNSVPYPDILFFNGSGSNWIGQCGPVIQDITYNSSTYPRRQVVMLSMSNGWFTAWNNGTPASLSGVNITGLTNTVGRSFGGYPTNNWNQLNAGWATTANDPNSGFGPVAFRDEISFIGVINQPMTTALAKTVNDAIDQLEDTDTCHVWLSDSRFQFQNTHVQTYHNPWSIPDFFHRSQRLSRDTIVYDFAQSGAKSWQGLAFTNVLLSHAPHGKIKKVFVYDDLGVNDFYGDGATAASIWPNVTNLTKILASSNIFHVKLTPYVLWTNAITPYTYDATKSGEITNFQFMVISNRLNFYTVHDVFSYVTQDMLNTNNSYSSDGLHLNPDANGHTNGWIINRNLGQKMLEPWINP